MKETPYYECCGMKYVLITSTTKINEMYQEQFKKKKNCTILNFRYDKTQRKNTAIYTHQTHSDQEDEVKLLMSVSYMPNALVIKSNFTVDAFSMSSVNKC